RLAPLKKRAAAAEARIAALEAEIAAWEERMASPDFFKKGNDTRSALDSYNDAKQSLEHTYEEWARLTAEIENAP
ncbi:MAG: hypothetical protein LBR07_04375, partial [Puniceicoccales bacterium]|nr:hypothetical protein [Puniceicoccales bacterium]